MIKDPESGIIRQDLYHPTLADYEKSDEYCTLIIISHTQPQTMCNTRRNVIQCILPPYIANKLGESEVVPLADSLDNELRNYRFRSDRKFFAAMPKADMEMMLVSKVKPAKPKPSIQIYDVGHKYSLPGRRMKAAEIAKDKDAKNVLTGTRLTWRFFHSIFSRNSLDDEGLTLVSSVHYGKKYKNGIWNGRQMVYGDGDRKVFGSFTLDVDIIAHELTHGVTQYAANFDYEHQPGALNESFSDVFGIMVKQYALNQTVEESNWLIGENIMLGDSYALRSLAAPGTAFVGHPSWGDDPQPATMDKYLHLPNTERGDWGGVHFNSGIPNYAFYIAAMEAGGYAWKTVGKVWYAALTGKLNNRSDFSETRAATIAEAKKLFGTNSKVHKAVVKGWKAAKVK